MPKVTVEIRGGLLADLDEHVGSEAKVVTHAIRASVRKPLHILDEVDDRHGRLASEESGESA